uniref:Chromosome 11 open reading frame 52 n=1 Tax=Anas platyrhynchos platyrhynchos TaxID=8840 RepID=A0A493U1N1_ANAPP
VGHTLLLGTSWELFSPFQTCRHLGRCSSSPELTIWSFFSPKAPTYENVSESPVYATVSKPKNMKQDDSIHYADIQVFTKVRERSAEEVKNLQMQNATEYATLNFPRPRLKYDSKNGTLV